jgi:hypothetical protein
MTANTAKRGADNLWLCAQAAPPHLDKPGAALAVSPGQ